MPSKVVIPVFGQMSRRLAVEKVVSVLSNRIKGTTEQYLVQWRPGNDAPANTEKPPMSWHNLDELSRCLELVQDYLEVREKAKKALSPKKTLSPKMAHKRKLVDLEEADSDVYRRISPLPPGFRPESSSRSQTPSARSSSVASASTPAPSQVDVYNGVIIVDRHGFVTCQTWFGPDTHHLELRHAPAPDMRAKVKDAYTIIRKEYLSRLAMVPGKRIHLNNIYDRATPSLRFRFIPENILRDGVHKADAATQEGCQKCSPHMGRSIGCEYTQKCACLEYAAVNESAITDPDMKVAYLKAKANGDSLVNFPKRFPYFAEGTKIQRAGTLVPFYLHSRRPIYECNDNCRCGPHCRNKNVQFGRAVEVEIFRTGTGRGWGLRCRQPLYEGQFIDTYRGEVITDAEATRREEAVDNENAKKTKASYLYSLDKFAESEQLNEEDLYVVDGEFFGGPTKFMNHSCAPNCRQYTVSYNKHDPLVYDIAFFACRDIPAGEELTFDYLDKDPGDAIEDPGPDAIPCLCGAEKCRKWLWT